MLPASLNKGDRDDNRDFRHEGDPEVDGAEHLRLVVEPHPGADGSRSGTFRAHPEYAGYRRRVPMLIPGFRRTAA